MNCRSIKRALILAGGWEGHKPLETAAMLSKGMEARGIQTEIETNLEILADANALMDFDLISPCWTMGQLSAEQSGGLQNAVRGGCGLAGIHGGAGDAFRGNLEYEWMIGGHFVGHPHVGEYTIRLRGPGFPITEGLPGAFPYRSEQYYMLVDPATTVLADADYHYEERICPMPVAWVKKWGAGRVFYSALGHDPADFDEFPHALELTLRGFQWAAGLL